MSTTARIDQVGMVAEEMPSLADVAQEAGGAWPKGWYPAEIIGGYSAGGYQFETADTASKAGDSRNLRIALRLTSLNAARDAEGNSVSAGASRNTFAAFNYRLETWTAANVARIKAGDQSMEQRTRISLAQLGQVEKALGFGFKRHPEGHINVAPLVGQRVDVRLTIGEKGFNEVTAFAAAGTRTGGRK